MSPAQEITLKKPLPTSHSPHDPPPDTPGIRSRLRFLTRPAFPLALFLHGPAFYAIAHFWFKIPHPAWWVSAYLFGVLLIHVTRHKPWKFWTPNWVDVLYFTFLMTVIGSLVLHPLEGKEKVWFYIPAFIVFPYICARVVNPQFWVSTSRHLIQMGVFILPFVTYEIWNMPPRHVNSDRMPLFESFSTTYSIGSLLGTLLVIILALWTHPGQSRNRVHFFSRPRHWFLIGAFCYSMHILIFIGARGPLVAFLFSALVLLILGIWKSKPYRVSIFFGLIFLMIASLLTLPPSRQQFYGQLMFFKNFHKIQREVDLANQLKTLPDEKIKSTNELPITNKHLILVQLTGFANKNESFSISRTHKNKGLNLSGESFDIHFPKLGREDIPFAVFFIHKGSSEDTYTLRLPEDAVLKPEYAVIELTKETFVAALVWNGSTWFPLPPEILKEKMGDCNVYGESTLNRLLMWQTALSILKRYPLFGVGSGNFDQESCLKQDLLGGPHNSFLHVLSELGLFGFSSFGALVFGGIVFLVKKIRTDPRSSRKLSCWLLLAVFGFHISNDQFFGNYFSSYSFYFLIGIVGSFVSQDLRFKNLTQKNLQVKPS